VTLTPGDPPPILIQVILLEIWPSVKLTRSFITLHVRSAKPAVFEQFFKQLRGRGKLTEANNPRFAAEVRRILLEADVNFKVAKDFVAGVQEKALGQEVLRSITPRAAGYQRSSMMSWCACWRWAS